MFSNLVRSAKYYVSSEILYTHRFILLQLIFLFYLYKKKMANCKTDYSLHACFQQKEADISIQRVEWMLAFGY